MGSMLVQIALTLIFLPLKQVPVRDFTLEDEKQVSGMLDAGWTLCGTPAFQSKLSRLLERRKHLPAK